MLAAKVWATASTSSTLTMEIMTWVSCGAITCFASEVVPNEPKNTIPTIDAEKACRSMLLVDCTEHTELPNA